MQENFRQQLHAFRDKRKTYVKTQLFAKAVLEIAISLDRTSLHFF